MQAGGNDVADGAGLVDFGDTPVGTPVTQTITVSNVGTLDLLLGTQLALRLPDIDPTVSLRAPIWPACLAFLPVHARLTALDRMAVDLELEER